MNQKGFINIILAVIIVVLVGVGVYFVSTRQNTPSTPTSNSNPNPIPTPAPILTPTPTPNPKTDTSGNLQIVGTSFSVRDTNEGALELKVFTAQDGKKYKAEVSGYDSWKLVYISPNVCFKKSTFVYTYCVHERVAGMDFVRAIIGITPKDSINNGKLTKEEEIAVSWTPTNALAAFLSHIELALVELRKGTLKDNLELKLQEDGGKILKVGLVSDVKTESATIEIPVGAIDLTKLANLLDEKGHSAEFFTSSLNLEYSDGDKRIVELMGKYNINPKNIGVQ